MRRLLAQTHPHTVLLGALGIHHSAVKYHHKQNHHHKLHIRVIAQAPQQNGVLVIDILNLNAHAQGYEMVVSGGHLGQRTVSGGGAQLAVYPLLIGRTQLLVGVGVGAHRLREVEVAELQDVECRVRYHYRDGVVLTDDAEQKFYVLVGLCQRQFLRCLRPDVHTFALLLGQVFHQRVADEHKRHNGRHGQYDEYQASGAAVVDYLTEANHDFSS